MLQPKCFELICYQIRVPYSYLRRCSQDLQAEKLNYWYRKFGEKELLVRFDGEDIRAIVTTRYKLIANSSILDVFQRNGYTGEVSYAIDSKMMKVDIPNFRSSFLVAGEEHNAAEPQPKLIAVSLGSFIFEDVYREY